MTTVGDLIDRTVNDWLEPSLRHTVNKLVGNVTTNATSLVLLYTQALDRGHLLGIDDEVFHVWSYDPTSKTATVQPKWHGTKTAAHSDGAIVEVDSRWFRGDVLRALYQELNAWPTSLYQVLSVTTSAARAQSVIDMPTAFQGCLGLVDARWQRNVLVTTSGTVQSSPYDTWPRLRYARIDRDMDVSFFPSGTAVKLGFVPYQAINIRLTAAMPFTASLLESTDVQSQGMTESQTDLLCMGAAIRLIHGQEAGRLDRASQGESRRAAEVPPMAATQAAMGLQQRYTKRLREEVQRLQMAWPIRFR
jgi:hypothetical protein